MLYKFSNTFLRIAPLGCKFILFTVLSKYLNPQDYGSFSLIATTITVSIFILGLDLYNFSIRDILTSKVDKYEKIYNVFVLYFCLYFIVATFALIYFFIFPITITNIKLVTTIMFICFSEHLSQEIYRLQIAFKQVLRANIIFFARVFIWISYLLICIMLFDKKIALVDIFNLWLVFNALAVIVNTMLVIKKLRNNTDRFILNRKYIKTGLRISLYFFLGTLSLKVIEYFNRYAVDYFLGKELTGVFSFYSNIVLMITVYINAIVVSFELPTLIENANNKNFNLHFKSLIKTFIKQIVFISIILLLVIKPVLNWQNLPLYENYLHVFFVLLTGTILMNFSLVYHFFLYVRNQDKTILLITVKAGVFSVFSTILLTYIMGLLGTSISFLLASGYLFYLRRMNVIKLRND